MNTSSLGIIGLGVMGKSLSLNALNNNISLSVYNRKEGEEANVVSDFMEDNSERQVQGFTELSEFVDSLEKPRKILLIIKAGNTVDLVINQLSPLLSRDDIIMDGGNSHFLDSKRRSENLMMEGILFMGIGISGGEQGALNGPSLMPGGMREAYDQVAPILKAMAAKSGDTICCDFIGPGGAGHYVKMVHNGIEYVEMQLLAEVISLLSTYKNYEKIADLLERWNKTDLESYLLEITIDILRKKEGNSYLVDLILDKAENKGTGSWSSKSAFDLGSTNTMMSEAVFARYISSYKSTRKKLAASCATTEKDFVIDENELEKAYRFSRLINHIQGFELLRKASSSYFWGLNLSQIASIWTEGCIIKSQLMNTLKANLKNSKKLYFNESVQKMIVENEPSASEILKSAIDARVHIPCLFSAQQYWVAITTEKLSANIIQAQRDYFGSHTYQRTDAADDQYFHTNWLTE